MVEERPLVVFRTAAGPRIGGGHLFRCLAVAQAVRALGARTAFALNDATGGLASVVDGEVRVVEAGDGTADCVDSSGEIEQMLAGFEKIPDWVVIDHYRRGTDYEEALGEIGASVLSIDDLCRPHAAGFVVDPAPGPDRDRYISAAPDSWLLLGAEFAPLRQTFMTAPVVQGSAGSVLIAFGAADPDGITVRVLNALAKRPNVLLDREVIALVGSGSSHRPAVEAAAAEIGARVLCNVSDMNGLLAGVSLAIGAGGVSALERCCMGIPSIVVEIADNQRPTIDALIAAGAALEIGLHDFESDLAPAVAQLLEDTAAWKTMSRAARGLCDGWGAARLADAMLRPIRDRSGAQILCRRASRQDAERLFEWQNEPGARRYARNPEPPGWTEHQAWFNAVMGDRNRLLLVVECQGKPVGMVRYDYLGPGRCEVSILISQAAVNKGIGGAALCAGEREASRAFAQWDDLPGMELLAYVDNANTASRRLFHAAGYEPVAGQSGWHSKLLTCGSYAETGA